jgi:thiamine pyrophosphokinase
MGYKNILIIAVLGERWDQTIANILLPAQHPGINILIQDGRQEFHYIHAGETLDINGRPGDTVSLIPLSSTVDGINTVGLEYPLTKGVLYFGKTRGVSNRLIEKTARVQINQGILLCTVIHQQSFSNRKGVE